MWRRSRLTTNYQMAFVARTLYTCKHMVKKILKFFDKLEDKIRIRLSHNPVLYAIIGAVGIILVWRGVEDIAGEIGLTGPFAFMAGIAILLSTGLLVSFFIGDSIIISGFKHEKKVADKTEAEIRAEQEATQALANKIDHIEHDLHELKKGRESHHVL